MKVILIDRLSFSGSRPEVLTINCYHVFTGLKRRLDIDEARGLKTRLVRLDRHLLETWYYRHSKIGLDTTFPIPWRSHTSSIIHPPEDWKSRLAYYILWILNSIKRNFSSKGD